MRNFKLFDGDLVLGNSNRLEVVYDYDKLVQDLTCWLLEPYGTGFMTPNFGSFLEYPGSKGFIGRPITAETEMELVGEIERILTLYQSSQKEKIKLARYNNQLNIFSRQEILNKIKNISIKMNPQRPDSYLVSIDLETASGTNVSLDYITSVEGTSIA